MYLPMHSHLDGGHGYGHGTGRVRERWVAGGPGRTFPIRGALDTSTLALARKNGNSGVMRGVRWDVG